MKLTDWGRCVCAHVYRALELVGVSTVEFYGVCIDVERAQQPQDLARLRSIYRQALHNHGKNTTRINTTPRLHIPFIIH